MYAPLSVFPSTNTSTLSSATTIHYPDLCLLPCLLPSTVTALDLGGNNLLAAFKERRRKLLLRDGKKRKESEVLVSPSSHLFSYLRQFFFFLSHTPGPSLLFLFEFLKPRT
jgi:hypothetical protein